MSAAKIQEAVEILSGGNLAQRVYAVDCEVISVDGANRTAQVRAIEGKARNTFTARLMAAVDDGVYFKPAVGSTVCVVLGNFTLPYVTQYSEIDSINFRGGEFGGLVKVIELTAKINALENALRELITKYNTHTHAGVTAGAGVSGPTATQDTTIIVNTVRTEIENELITHG